ncbi:filamentous hemagglutinin N-terminal domain-containing protein, partial [Pseudanabaenaceae cyanobacterium LEGE 13415]|nr:filamentous hemagglutinin N-terminal domain-containing protein [Pseudanabaenaceae cyanobacterium LEGE 13415]
MGNYWSLHRVNSWVVAGSIVAFAHPACSQVTPDATLGVEQSIVTSTTNNGSLRQQIEGGATRGNNLFHSFREFNIAEGQSLYFQAPLGIQNIISRVTGGSPSNIEGTLGIVGSTANLFLLNPNGIFFGANARLDVRGSFVATTASAVQFGTQGFYSSSAPESPPLLTVNPSALLFNSVKLASIVNRSTALLESGGRGLQVPE